MTLDSTSEAAKRTPSDNQRSALRCRIRDNATAVISGKLQSLKKPYKPDKGVDVDDPTWKSLWQEYHVLMEKVDEFKNTKDIKGKNDIIRSLRKQYPKIARDHLEPKDPIVKLVTKPVEKPLPKPIERYLQQPVPKPVEKSIEQTSQQPAQQPAQKPFQTPVEKPAEKSPAVPRQGTEPPPSYDRACGLTGTVQVNQTFSRQDLTHASEVQALQELFPNFRPQPAYAMSPTSTAGTKRSAPDPVIKPEPEIDLTQSPEPEDTRDGDYTETAASRSGKRRKRAAVTEADLEYQLTELNFKHRLQQITIKKAMAKLKGDQMAEAQLQLEEADVQHEQKKAAVARKMEELRKEG